MGAGSAYRWSVGWMIAGILAAAVLVDAAYYLHSGWRYGRDIEAWQTAEPVRAVVDLSKPGQWRAPFHQTCSVAYREWIELRVSPAFESDEAAWEALAGLKAKLRVVDTDGRVEQELDLSPERVVMHGEVPMLQLSPFRRGTYEMTLLVEEGAVAMAGHKQELVGRYEFEGFEALPVFIAFGSGGLLGVIGVVLGRLAYPRMRRRSRLSP